MTLLYHDKTAHQDKTIHLRCARPPASVCMQVCSSKSFLLQCMSVPGFNTIPPTPNTRQCVGLFYLDLQPMVHVDTGKQHYENPSTGLTIHLHLQRMVTLTSLQTIERLAQEISSSNLFKVSSGNKVCILCLFSL